MNVFLSRIIVVSIVIILAFAIPFRNCRREIDNEVIFVRLFELFVNLTWLIIYIESVYNVEVKTARFISLTVIIIIIYVLVDLFFNRIDEQFMSNSSKERKEKYFEYDEKMEEDNEEVITYGDDENKESEEG